VKGVLNMKKKILSIILAGLLLSTVFAYGDMLNIYEEYEEDYINKGIIHQHYERYTDKGKVTINILKVKIDKNNQVKPIYNKEGIIHKKSLSQLTGDNKAVAGINGDFYNPNYPSYPVGALFNREDLVSSPNLRGYEYPTLIKRGNDYIIDTLKDMINIETEEGKILKISAVNKMGTFSDEIVVLNRNWGEKSLGKYKDNNLLEILVFGGRVREIRENGDPFEIPDNGYVILTNGNNKEKLKSILEERTKVEIKYNFDLDNIDWGMGGANHLVKEGKLYNINEEILGRQPRSAVAINEDKDEIYFIAVDGRSSNSVGFTQEELADFIIGINGYEAMNLDGGGSTTLTAERYDKIEVLNFPSDGIERNIVSGLGVFSDYKSSDKDVEFIKINLDNKFYFKDQDIKVELTGYNKYFIPVEIEEKSIRITTDLNSRSIDGNVKIKETGKGIIKVNYKGLKDEIPVEIIEGPYELQTNTEIIKVGRQEQFNLGEFYAVGEKGIKVKIDPNDIKWTSYNFKGKVDDGIFISGNSDGKGYLKGDMNEAYIKIPVSIGYREVDFYDFEDLGSLKYEEYPENSGGEMYIYPRASEGRNSLKLNYDFTKMENGDQAIAFVEFRDEGVTLPGEPIALRLSVFGDKKDHWLRTRIIDANGDMYKIDFAEKVDWWGWKEVTAQIPKEAKYPIKLQNIYLAEIYDDMRDSGSIYLDDLKLLYSNDTEENKTLEKSKYSDMYNKEPEEYEHIIEFIENKMYLNMDEEKYDNNNKNILYYELMSLDGSILGKIQEIKEISLLKDKKIIINTNNPIENLYQNEYNGFIKLMEEALKNGSEVVVVYKGDSSGIYYQNGFRYIRYTEDLNLFINEENFYYKFN